MQPIPKKKERKKGRRKRKEKQIGGNNLFFQRLKLPYFSEIHTFRLVDFSFFPIIIINAIRQYKFVNDLNNDKIIKRERDIYMYWIDIFKNKNRRFTRERVEWAWTHRGMFFHFLFPDRILLLYYPDRPWNFFPLSFFPSFAAIVKIISTLWPPFP